MKVDSNATALPRVTPGVLLGAAGVLGFSFTLPATRFAVAELDPWLVAFWRAVGAGLLAAGYLTAIRAPLPNAAQLRRLVVIAAGIVIGFPVLTSLALVSQTSAHSAVVIACLPMATAVLAVLRTHERPHSEFWLASAVGMVAVLVFMWLNGNVGGAVELADLYLFGAVALGAIGYVEGGALSRELGGPQTVSWALVISLPMTVPAAVLVSDGADVAGVGPAAWLGLGYVTVVSMFLGFFAWYAGMARGGVARIGQIQLAQPVLTLAWSALLLSEHVGPVTLGAALAVLACVVWTQRTRAHKHP